MLDRLNAHRAWANRLYVEWINGPDAAEAYCLKMLSHVLRAEEAWLIRLRGGIPENKLWTIVPPKEMDVLRESNDEGLGVAASDDLSRILRYRRFDGTEMESSVADILTHVCAHGVYHRGQVAAQASRLSLPKIPSTDFILFAGL